MGIAYNPSVVAKGLSLALDAANVKSYNTSGTTWTDLSSKQSNATLSSQLRTDVANKGSLYFDGTSSYAEGGVIEPTYYTLSCTFKATGEPSTNDQFGGVLICNSIQLTNGLLQYALEYSWANQRVVFVSQTNTNVFATSDNSVLRNKIYKVDAVYDGSTQKIYVNGELVTSRSWTTNPVYGTTGNRNVQIGRFGYTGYERYFNGYIYEAKVYDRALTADEILQNYIALSGRFKDPDIVTDGLVLNLDAANGSSYPASGTTWTDLSGNGNNGTLTNGPTFDPISGGSIVFDGVNDQIVTGYYVPGSARSYFVWIKYNKVTSLSGGYALTGTQQVSAYTYVGIINGGEFYYYGGTTGGTISGTKLQANVWYQQGLVIFSDGSRKLYLNGVEIHSATGSVGNTATLPFQVGRVNSGGHFVDGNIAQVSLYNRALTAAEIQQNYNAFAPRYTRPSIVSDGLVLNLDAGSYSSYPESGTTWTDLSGNSNNGTLTNGPTYSSGSIVFDGTDDYISSVSIPNPNGELTCEVAMNYDSKGAYHNIFDRGSSRPMLWIDPNNKLEVSFSTGSGGITSSDAYNGQDIVVTAVYNSNSSPGILLYVNGNLVGTKNTAHVTWPNPSTFTLFNRNNSQTFDGKLYYLRFYTKALSASEIKQNFNALRDRFGI